MRVRVGRNLARFPLPGAMNRQDRIDMEVSPLFPLPPANSHVNLLHTVTPSCE